MLKDHKPNFTNNPTARLINPSKPELGRISREILQRINSTILKKSSLMQWKKTSDVLQWFKDLKNKEKIKFMQFDICEFYTSITQHPLHESPG